MDKDERLQKILGQLSGGRLEEVADKLIALFRQPEWWEEEFEKRFVARGSIGAFQDTDTCDAVKAFISASSHVRNTRNVKSCSWTLNG